MTDLFLADTNTAEHNHSSGVHVSLEGVHEVAVLSFGAVCGRPNEVVPVSTVPELADSDLYKDLTFH